MDNVFVFVMDSLRWDFLPARLGEMGVVFKSVAQSLFSAPSFATLSTGRYPPEHGVFDWENTVPQSVPTIYDTETHHGGFFESQDSDESPMYSVLGVEKTPLEEQEPPFIHLERDGTPHLPFGGASSVEEYFRARRSDWQVIRNEYRGAIERSVDLLESRLEYLQAKGLLDSTLIVVTSDHGDLFGEHGCVAHSAPAAPELAYVPTVFIHPSLSEESFLVDPDRDVIEHVDVIETALSAVDASGIETSGTDLQSEPRPRSWGYNHIDLSRRGQHFYTAESIWWRDSGYVFTRNGLSRRLAYAVQQLMRGSSRHALRDSPISLLKTLSRSRSSFGSPPISISRAEAAIDALTTEFDVTDSLTTTLSDATEERLQQLGYLDS